MDSRVRATLVLENGSKFEGWSFGARKSVAGEAVFQTGMVGYTEALTDPSYHGQLLLLTYPLIGNYGVPSEEVDEETGIPKFFESNRVWASGLIVCQYSDNYSHWNATRSLSDWLTEHGVPGITGIDSRALTKLIREEGTMLGKIIVGDDTDIPFVNPNLRNLVAEVSRTEVKVIDVPAKANAALNGNQEPRITICTVDCGMKNNQLRCFLNRGVRLIVVPWNSDLIATHKEYKFDGLFISNGPGDPELCSDTIQNLRNFIDHCPMPIFGICLGHQLLSVAAGFSTYKLPYGNRGHNQPCIDEMSQRCYITSQNHGFAVDTSKEKTPKDWKSLFFNANDNTNEGVMHRHKPFFSVQFHPEARAGPQDTEFLFDVFMTSVRNHKQTGTLESVGPLLTRLSGEKDKASIKPINPGKVVILGSGGLSIGQAGEFDYSGSQAIKALKEEGIYTVLINPNIATVQTSRGLADKVYFLPVNVENVIKVMKNERPDGILLTFGGQTALNCGTQLYEMGIFEELGVDVLGTPISSILDTEDRERFNERLKEIGEPHATSEAVCDVESAIAAANRIGYPLIVRAAFALGGLGSGFAENEEELRELTVKALTSSSQVLVERSMKGWKEVEYEVVRDAYDNCITVCNMENFDPLGIHTGDSIVVAPSQTLTDEEYNMLRNAAQRTVRMLGVVGECNIQFALNPHCAQYCTIEVNARLSRSSALASKATGYPLAFVAAKLALKKRLSDLQNSITKKTIACFEPSLDYLVVKMPRWDLKKFERVSRKLGSSMKSVGEVMSIGRTLEEAMQKAIRMVSDNYMCGFESGIIHYSEDEMRTPTDARLPAIASGLQNGVTVDELHDLTRIDKWFLSKLRNISEFERYVRKIASSTAPDLSEADFIRAKELGFSDRHLGKLLDESEIGIRRQRLAKGILPCVKQIDTVAAEFPAQTNYLYMTYASPLSKENDIGFQDKGIMVLGSGAYRIGSSVEFDWCAVSAIRTLKAQGIHTIMMNYNPETVSTDYDECDRLYFEELSFERVLDVYNLESSRGIIVCMGGQIPNNLAMLLHRQQVNILGTSPDMIDGAENRYKFSRMCDRIQVDQPRWKELTSVDDAKAFCASVGYPVLVRPSYVLSGAAMNVAHKAEDLEAYLTEAASVSTDCPVVISKFILEAKEIEVDAVARKGELVMHVVSEHVENAGVHSGDATLVLPPADLDHITVRKVEEATRMVANALNVTGPMNIQFIAKDNEIKVIECNLRASRSFPFVSKTTGVDLAKMATKVILGKSVEPYPIDVTKTPHVGVKVAQFSFTRLLGADPILGVEMASTGEVACYGATREEAYLKALVATGQNFDLKTICISIGAYKDKLEFLSSAKILKAMGITLFATSGTCDFLKEHGVDAKMVMYPMPNEHTDDSDNNVIGLLREKKIGLLVNIPSNNKYRRLASFTSAGYLTRRAAVDFGVPLITNIKLAKLLVRALKLKDKRGPFPLRPFDARFSSRVITLPGLVSLDVLDATNADWKTVTADALKGGFTFIGAVARSSTPASIEEDLAAMHTKAAAGVRCDYALYAAGTPTNAASVLPASYNAQGLFIETEAKENSVIAWLSHIESWPTNSPIIIKASGRALASLLFGAVLNGRELHIRQVRTREDIQIIRMSKENGLAVTCDVDVMDLYARASSDRISASDRESLWEALDIVDAIVGPPALLISLIMQSEYEGRVTSEWVKSRLVDNPRRILGLSEQKDTYVEVDMSESFEAPAASELSGVKCRGKVRRVVLRGDIAYLDGKVWSAPGSARNDRGSVVDDASRLPSKAKTNVDKGVILNPPAVLSLDQDENLSPRVKVQRDLDGSAAEGRTVLRQAQRSPRRTPSPLPLLRAPSERSGTMTWLGRHFLSVKKLERDELHVLFNCAYEMRQMVNRMGQYDLLRGKILANLFYEPSTRTSCSFEAAMTRLGGQTISVREMAACSVAKGESLEDTVRTMECYSDVIVLRHPEEGAVKRVSNFCRKPVINAGDGVGEHPTQALLDVFTIREELGTVNGITIAFVGDLANGRTVHSLARLLSLYNVKLRYVSPESLRIPSDVLDEVASRGVDQSEHTDLDEVLRDCDVLYVTRVQKERFTDNAEYERLKHQYRVTPKTLTRLKETAIIMHPLPRVGEISADCDSDPRAVYFRQVEYGMYIRMAILAMVIGKA